MGTIWGKYFTDDQAMDLKMNPNVQNATNKAIIYTENLKRQRFPERAYVYYNVSTKEKG